MTFHMANNEEVWSELSRAKNTRRNKRNRNQEKTEINTENKSDFGRSNAKT